jgi:hypothetical protein
MSAFARMFRDPTGRLLLPYPPLHDPQADIVLRSSDKAVFKLRKIHLMAASTFFDHLFSYPEIGTVGHEVDGLAVVDMSESREDLRLLLSVLLASEDHGKLLTLSNAST